MGDPTPSYAALVTFMLPPRWTGRCRACGHTVTRAWWQRGPFTPLELCPRGALGLCLTRRP